MVAISAAGSPSAIVRKPALETLSVALLSFARSYADAMAPGQVQQENPEA